MKRFLFIMFVVTSTFGAAIALAQPPAQLSPVKVQIYTPDSAVRLAAADLATVDVSERPYIRYLSLYNIPAEERVKVATTVSFAVNSLGKRRKMYIPLFVGGSDNTLIRLNIDNYEWDAKTWDTLAEKGSGPKPQAEPYFHALIDKFTPGEKVKKRVFKEITTTKRVHAGYYQNTGQPYYKDVQVTEKVEVEEEVASSETTKKKIFAGAPWVDATALAYLIEQTQAQSPILRADWFITNALVPPAYYDFLGLGKTQKDFENLIFANEELAKKARSQDKAVVITSTVARNNRTLNRSPTFTNGYYWVSHDSFNSVDDRQYVQNLLDEKFDATEDIGTLPNGLQAYFLTDGKGNRLDFANPDIAIDNTAHDRVVRTGRSCIVCHGDGIKPIQDEVRTLTKKLQNKESVALLVANKKDAYRIDDLFGSNLDEQIVKDQNIYSAAVAKATGLKMEVNAKQYSTIYNDYQEILVTKEVLARDLGVHVDDVERLIRLSNDPTVLALIRFPPGPVRRDQWERSFQGMQLIVLAQRQGAVPIQPLPPFIKK